MKKSLLFALIVLTVPSLAMAHISVRPRDSKPGAEERSTVRVPAEGAVATPHVQLESPADVTVLEVLPAEGATFETAKQGDRIATITWKKAKLVSASNPVGAQAASGDAAAVEAWLKGYDAAFMAKDLEKLATFYHPDVTIYEGGGINNGWADYRDHHLGPELKAFENLQFGHTNTKVTVLPGGQSAYATSEYAIKAKMGERVLDSSGLETLVLVKGADGTWKIRHSHTSSRPRRPAA